MGGSNFAKNGNWPISIAKNGNVVYISADCGHKQSKRVKNIILEERKTEICNIIVIETKNHRS